MLTLYNAVSSEGFIARKDGNEDFIPDNLWQNFINLCEEYGALIMGRNTYDTIQNYGEEFIQSFEELPIKKIVVSSNQDFNPKKGLHGSIAGTILVALCCFTPILVITVGVIGLGAFTPYLDYILFPALGVMIVVTILAYLKWKRGCDTCGVDKDTNNLNSK